MIIYIKKIISLILFWAIILPSNLFSISSVTDANFQENYFLISNLWMLLAGFLVFIMHLGFACLEAGLTQIKKPIYIFFKYICIMGVGTLTYVLIGFSLTYPQGWLLEGWLGWSGWGLTLPSVDKGLIEYRDEVYTYWTSLIFQAMIAIMTVAIISSAIRERIKLIFFLLFSIFYVGMVYPLLGSWKWGGGWLNELGFYDFAGSTIVHSIGGWGALAGNLLIGPQFGKYLDKNTVNAIPSHSIPLAFLGCFLLCLGWFGFNGGSIVSTDGATLSFVCLTTLLAACGGILGSYLIFIFFQKKLGITLLINGILGGLVSITAGANVVTIYSAILVGMIGGALVVLAVIFIDVKLHINDPVGAISVHLVGGIWGTLAVGIFSQNSEHSLIIQFIGVAAIGSIAFLSSLIIFTIIKAIGGVKVN